MYMMQSLNNAYLIFHNVNKAINSVNDLIITRKMIHKILPGMLSS